MRAVRTLSALGLAGLFLASLAAASPIAVHYESGTLGGVAILARRRRR